MLMSSMGQTRIEWTQSENGTKGYVWNPVTGCSEVSPGCEHCYTETLSHRFGCTTESWTAPHAAHNVQCHPDRLYRHDDESCAGASIWR